MPVSRTFARPGRATVLIAVVIGVLGTAVSAIGSGTASLWGDEAASVLSATRPVSSLATMVQNVDAVHGTYYLGLHAWILLAGTSPTALRFPSAVAIGAAVAGLVLIGARLRGLQYGILAGVVGAVLPRMTDVGSEARSYALSAAIAVGLSLIAVVAVQTSRPRRRLWVLYGALLAVGIYVFLYIALIAVAHLVVLLIAHRESVRSWVRSFAVAVALAAPVLVFAVGERSQIAYLQTRQSYNVTSLFVSPWFENPLLATASWPLVIVGIVLAVRAWRGGAHRWSTSSPFSRGGLVPVLWLVLPATVLLAASPLIAVFTPRYLAMSAPAVALLVAVPLDVLVTFGAQRPGLRGRLATAVAGLVLLGLLGLIAPIWSEQRTAYAKNNSDWAEISAQLGRLARPGDAVAFDDATRPSRRPRLAFRTYPAGFAGLDDLTLKTPFTNSPTWYDETYTLAEARALGRFRGVTRVWLIEYAEPGHIDDTGISSLTSAGFHQQLSVRTHRSVVLEFVRSNP